MRFLIRLVLVIFGGMTILLAGMQHLKTQANAPQGWLLYTSNYEGNEHIYRLWGNGSHRERLVENAIHNNTALASPDRKWIFFNSDRTGNYKVYRIAWEGSEPQPLMFNWRTDFLAHISPDGRWFYILSQQEGDTWGIYRVRPNGTNAEALTASTTGAMRNSIHFGGQKVIYTSGQKGDYEVFVFDMQTAALRNLTQAPASDEYPHLSPDGQWAVYSAYEADTGNYELYRVRTDGTDRQRLTRSPEWETHPQFSTDGKWIFFIRNRGDQARINRMRSDGSDAEVLSKNSMWDGNLLVSEDGKWLFFSAFKDGSLEIYRMRTDGTARQRLTHHSGDDYPSDFVSLAIVPNHRPEIIAGGTILVLGAIGIRRWRR